MEKSLEKKYRKLTDVEHVLARPGMYVGSIKPHESDVYVLNDQGKFQKTKTTYNPAFLKIFDEIISNSIDEHKRNPRLNRIDVVVDQKLREITILDNGGIPVKMHKEYDEWIPEMIFSNLKTGSNFDDSESRLVAGTNGVGATLTNIFSTIFRVRTCDGSKEFTQIFTKNMHEKTKPVVKPHKKNYTEILYRPDLSRFGMEEIDEIHLALLKKRVIDAAACNPKLTVTFNGEVFRFKNFQTYCEMYVDSVFFEESGRWKIAVGVSDDSFQQVSFVNSVETKDGGTHVEYIANQIAAWMREKIRKKYKFDIKPSEFRNHIFLFVNADIVNSSFSSQTKEKLITEVKDFGSTHEVSEKILKQIFNSDITKNLLDWIEKKQLAEERKQLRALNKFIDSTKIVKLIDAKGKDRENCTLAIFEGDSASSAFRQYRDPNTQGAFPLRGKFINVMELANTDVIQNKEVKSLLASVGLKMGEEPANLRYGKILLYTDADPDGDSIAGLMMNFFGKYWPELFEQGRICRVLTPLVVAKKGSESLWFYTAKEFDEWQSKQKSLNSWNVEYKKGLAALENEEYLEIIRNPRLMTIEKGEKFHDTLMTWFAGDSTPRKHKILGTEPDENSRSLAKIKAEDKKNLREEKKALAAGKTSKKEIEAAAKTLGKKAQSAFKNKSNELF
jgi:DNA topoisomerase-2